MSSKQFQVSQANEGHGHERRWAVLKCKSNHGYKDSLRYSRQFWYCIKIHKTTHEAMTRMFNQTFGLGMTFEYVGRLICLNKIVLVKTNCLEFALMGFYGHSWNPFICVSETIDLPIC